MAKEKSLFSILKLNLLSETKKKESPSSIIGPFDNTKYKKINQTKNISSCQMKIQSKQKYYMTQNNVSSFNGSWHLMLTSLSDLEKK